MSFPYTMFSRFSRTLFTKLKNHLYICILCVTYISVFSIHIFIMNDVNQSFLGSMGWDHASMLKSMITILSKKHLYNQMAAHHSSYYGWTYFSLSFLFLAPVKLFSFMAGANSWVITYIGLKALHFVYGMMAVITFYYLARKLTKDFYAFLGSFILAFGSPLTYYLYVFHPESIGILFLNLGFIFLLNVVNTENPKRKHYYIASLFFILSALAKPTFLFICFPAYMCLLTAYTRKTFVDHSIRSLVKNTKFIMLLSCSLLFMAGIFFVINPSFFILFRKAIGHQLKQAYAFSHSSAAIQSWQGSMKAWVELIVLHSNIVFTTIIVSCINLVLLILNKNVDKLRKNICVIINVSIICFILFVVLSTRLFISLHYLIPVMSLLLLNFIFLIDGVERKFADFKKVIRISVVIIIVLLSFNDIKGNIIQMVNFYDYKNNQSYEVYTYIRDNMPRNSTIIHDQFVAIPDDKNLISYHCWEKKNTVVFLESINADYIIFYPEYRINNIIFSKTLIPRQILEDKKYIKIKTIGTIEVWKKLDQ